MACCGVQGYVCPADAFFDQVLPVGHQIRSVVMGSHSHIHARTRIYAEAHMHAETRHDLLRHETLT